MTGDGGFFLNVGELWTAVQEGLDLVVLVMNDRGYGVIKRIQDATAQGRQVFAPTCRGRISANWPRCRTFRAFKCSSAETFGATVAKALAIKGLTMVEVDMVAVGEFPPYYPFNRRAGRVNRSHRAHITQRQQALLRSPGRPPSAVAFTSPSANRSRMLVPGFTPAAWVIGAPAGSVTSAEAACQHRERRY